jgi:hypothetical protein
MFCKVSEGLVTAALPWASWAKRKLPERKPVSAGFSLVMIDVSGMMGLPYPEKVNGLSILVPIIACLSMKQPCAGPSRTTLKW